mgnify:CR=1 FL=1
MSTETQQTTDGESLVKQLAAQPSGVEVFAAVGIVGSLLVWFATLFLVIDETVGAAFATQPEWFIVAFNTILFTPITILAAVTAAWWLDRFTTVDGPDYREFVVYGVVANTVAMPPLSWVLGLGVL